MCPRERRQIALILGIVFGLSIFCVLLYLVPNFLYSLLIIVVSCIACFYHSNDQFLYTREGRYPRPSLTVPPVLRRWFPGKTQNGLPSVGVNRRGNRVLLHQEDVGIHAKGRLESPGTLWEEAADSNSLFSPRDFLKGSYVGMLHVSPYAGGLRGGGTRELRERLSRPNHTAHSPNRRLSFGEGSGVGGRFTMTPLRHHSLRVSATSALGGVPLTQWDDLKRSILTPQKVASGQSPVTVKIARPGSSVMLSPCYTLLTYPRSPLSPGLRGAVDPCSRETVLSVLRERRKRDADQDEDPRGFAAAQKSKRRRHDSNGSSSSAFESRLPNGATSPLVPKPGKMKRGMNSLLGEESHMKRSRTSPVWPLGSIPSPCGSAGSPRNSILSSYSSSKGLTQMKRASSPSLSPISSPLTSHLEPPDRPSKKPREIDSQSPSSKSEKTPLSQPAVTGSISPAPKPAVPPPLPGSEGSEGKRKRKIQLIPSRRGDHISLLPPPELGYTVTVTDLDSEKRAALEHINKVLEEPAPAPDPTAAPVETPFHLAPAASSLAPASASLLLDLLKASGSLGNAPPPVSTPGAEGVLPAGSAGFRMGAFTASGPTPALANPLLDSLKKMAAPVFPTASAAPPSGIANVLPVTAGDAGADRSEPGLALTSPGPAVVALTQPPSSSLSAALSQVTGQPPQPPTLPGASSLFTLPAVAKTYVAPTTSSSTPVSTESPSSTPDLVFQPSFKPLFGSVPSSSAFGQPPAVTSAPPPYVAPSLSGGGFMFGGLSSATATSATSVTSAPIVAQTLTHSLFGSKMAARASAGSPHVGPTPASAAATSESTTSTASPFLFSSMATTTSQPAPQTGLFSFSQPPSSQPSTNGVFGGFGASGSTTTTTAAVSAPVPTPASQTPLTFGKSSLNGPTMFSNGTQGDGPKLLSFGSNGVSGLKPLGFGGVGTPPTSVTARALGTAVFGNGTSAFAFGNSSTSDSSAAPAFSFGGAAVAQPGDLAPNLKDAAQVIPGGFSFGASSVNTQLAALISSNPTTQTPNFSFGANSANNSEPALATPVFGQSNAGPSLFGSANTPASGFSGLAASPFGVSPAPSFSIGSSSRPMGARQRLQARRQHPRKK